MNFGQQLIWIYRRLNLLSVDVVIGTVICSIYFADLLKVNSSSVVFLVLGFTVWIIYTADHLLDARKVISMASTERHRFHQKYFRTILFFLMGAVVVTVVLLLLLDTTLIRCGVVLIGVVAFYLFFQRYLILVKEFFAATLYILGVLLPAVALSGIPSGNGILLIFIQFFLISYINLILFSWFDLKNDHQDRIHSVATRLGSNKVILLLIILFSTSFALIASLFIYYHTMAHSIILLFVMNVALLCMFIFKNWFAIHDRFRLIGDLIFILPIFFLF